MKFETFKNELNNIMLKNKEHYANEIAELDKIQPYGKAYFLFENRLGITPKEFMVIEDNDKLEVLYDYLLKAYKANDTYCGIATLDDWVIDETKIAVIFDIFISNAILNKERSQERLHETRVELANLLRSISKDDERILSDAAYAVMDLNFNHLFENCRILLEERNL